ncbi:hypothetical protein HNR46_001589 [Haloferula luteola]|uniref:Uncharacterized protein n=1 Tax=Haloferula luteola TaxID=595692 RepID=A0A840V1R7_9BACT|nr:hypothetical protein [Haloferula luteola]MBB5351353.1 hypothetical protein [Haloferula luteola]
MERDEEKLNEIIDELMRSEISLEEARPRLMAAGMTADQVEYMIAGMGDLGLAPPPEANR